MPPCPPLLIKIFIKRERGRSLPRGRPRGGSALCLPSPVLCPCAGSEWWGCLIMQAVTKAGGPDSCRGSRIARRQHLSCGWSGQCRGDRGPLVNAAQSQPAFDILGYNSHHTHGLNIEYFTCVTSFRTASLWTHCTDGETELLPQSH